MNRCVDLDHVARDLLARSAAVRGLARRLDSVDVPDWESPAAAGYRRRLARATTQLSQQADELEALSRLALSVAAQSASAKGAW